MNRTRQNNQQVLALEPKDRGEAPARGDGETEPFMAKSATENSAFTEQLMEEVCDRENLERAWKRVKRNKGSPGVDGMTIDDAKAFLRQHWPNIRSQLLDGNYRPQPVRRVLVSPESSCLCRLNSIEPPWYGPVCPVVWEGWRRETSPYPDQGLLCKILSRLGQWPPRPAYQH